MSKKNKRYLIETSAVPAATGFSSAPHVEHFISEVSDGSLHTSNYVRMETLRRFVCEWIEFAELVDQCSTVSDAVQFWTENYGRKPKAIGFVQSELLRSGIRIENDDPHGAAVECGQIALSLIEIFDVRLKSRTQNNCGCMIGGSDVAIDGNSLLRTLSDFRRQFLKNVEDCPVNDFLHLPSEHGRAAKLLACDRLTGTAKIRSVRQPLEDLLNAKATISCREFATIGDPIIALEQPNVFTLAHVDGSYNHLCDCTGRSHKQIRSNASFKPPPQEGV